MAVDIAGAEAARPWLENAGAEFPCALDEHGILTVSFGLGVVSATMLFDENARLMRPIVRARPDEDDHARQLETWARGGRVPSLPARQNRETESGNKQALAWRRLASMALRDRDVTAAASYLDNAWALEPDNMQVRKQRWALRHPERFYAGDIDREWQRIQLDEGR